MFLYERFDHRKTNEGYMVIRYSYDHRPIVPAVVQLRRFSHCGKLCKLGRTGCRRCHKCCVQYAYGLPDQRNPGTCNTYRQELRSKGLREAQKNCCRIHHTYGSGNHFPHCLRTGIHLPGTKAPWHSCGDPWHG